MESETNPGLWGSLQTMLANPTVRAGLLQASLAAMQPIAPGQTRMGHLANAAGQGFEVGGRVADQQRKLADDQREQQRLDQQDQYNQGRMDLDERQLAESTAQHGEANKFNWATLGMQKDNYANLAKNRDANTTYKVNSSAENIILKRRRLDLIEARNQAISSNDAARLPLIDAQIRSLDAGISAREAGIIQGNRRLDLQEQGLEDDQLYDTGRLGIDQQNADTAVGKVLTPQQQKEKWIRDQLADPTSRYDTAEGAAAAYDSVNKAMTPTTEAPLQNAPKGSAPLEPVAPAKPAEGPTMDQALSPEKDVMDFMTGGGKGGNKLNGMFTPQGQAKDLATQGPKPPQAHLQTAKSPADFERLGIKIGDSFIDGNTGKVRTRVK